MARHTGDPCRNCGVELAPGAAFCVLCGAAVANRAAAPAPATVPLSGVPVGGAPSAGAPLDGRGNAVGSVTAVPGIIAVGTQLPAPLVEPRTVGVDPRLAAAAALVPGGAGRRLAAQLLDGVIPAVVLAAAMVGGLSLMSVRDDAGYRTIDFSWLAILTSIASLASLGYWIWLWLWEARAGKTPGNALLGLRTTGMDGHPAGLLAVFLRKLMIGLGSVVPVVGPLVVTVSNAWDPHGKRQGWHDKVAHTLVFNVGAGRNPLETGGIAGRESYVPAPMPAISPVGSPLPAAPAPLAVPAPDSSSAPAGIITAVPFARAAAVPPAGMPQGESSENAAPLVSSFAPPVAEAIAPQPFADDDFGPTRVRPVAAAAGLRIVFDDGRTEDIDTVALVGRNPAGYDGEMIARLVSVQDSGRSVSKTHLHVRASAEGLWVTDRNSTNGSAITDAAGRRMPLAGGTAALAAPGSRVHFGDRSFLVGGA